MLCHEFEASTAEDPPCREGRCTLNLEAHMSSRCCGVEVKRRGSNSVVVLVTLLLLKITTSVARSPRAAL
ncbi:hypothetical protein TNCV_110401 [Trichonephila clavipes]|nr:hypothetical protein TNCV_110401 [Trichonephila clavipes]